MQVTVILSVAAGLYVCGRALASEFPERECCDPVYPLPAVSASVTPDPPSSVSASSAVTQETHTGHPMKSKMETFNCLLARQLCFEDPSCSPILETIPRVCGAEFVSCSTVTVTKCQAALRTLQLFPFFKPTCLCREPQVDQECNSFRNFLFDHPCMFVTKKEKDPYPIEALPTCNHALSVCQKEKSCSQLYENFKTHCKVREGKCLMEDREACHEAWTNIRYSPMFGCICPNNHMKKRCDRVFSLVNHNPCIVKEISEDTPSSFDGVESQLENPLVGLRGAILKEVNGPNQEHLSGYSKLFGSRGNSATSHRSHPGTSKISPSSGPKAEENASMTFQSTCNQALELCNNNWECRAALAPVLDSCHATRCRRQACMDALQTLYRTVDLTWSLEIAFCLCKKTKNNQDECLLAQEVLHPVCAQQVEGAVVPTCHSLAEYCREDDTCKVRLETYEQSCAVDSVTKQCAGAPGECRKAMLGILGTALRSNCACKGTDFSQLYDCMGWQRVLWFNPCVVESQREFHTKKLKNSFSAAAATTAVSLVTTSTSTTTTTATPGVRGTVRTSPATTTTTTTIATTTSTTVTRPPTPAPTTPTTTTSTTHTTPTTTTTPSTTTSTTVTTTQPTTLETTTQYVTTESTLPPRFCVVQRPHQLDQYISEGEGKRLYRDDEPDCSEICQCGEGELLACNTICVDRAACKTDFAFYNHAAPAYQAYRGRCLCYSGRFICMRPAPGSYKLPQGVFLFLGYSEADEALLKPLIKMEVQDAALALEMLIKKSIKPKFNCNLSLYSLSKENIILVAKLAEVNSSLTRNLQQQSNSALLRKEKEECVGALQNLSEKVNSRHPLVHSHLLLSIFKMAEVEVVVPVSSSSSPVIVKHMLNIALVVCLMTVQQYCIVHLLS